MGKFAENLNLGKRVRPPLGGICSSTQQRGTARQGFWTYLYFRIRHSFAHVWTILNKMAAFGIIAHVRTILNKMVSFGVNIYRSSTSEHGQNITNITTI